MNVASDSDKAGCKTVKPYLGQEGGTEKTEVLGVPNMDIWFDPKFYFSCAHSTITLKQLWSTYHVLVHLPQHRLLVYD